MKPGLPLPPEGHDLGLDMIESQCAATCDPGRAHPCLTLSNNLTLSNRSQPTCPSFLLHALEALGKAWLQCDA